MSHFVYDNTDLAYPKSDLNVLPEGANPDQYVVAAEWNTAMQAIADLRDAQEHGKYIGFEEQPTDPTPSGPTNYMWMADTGLMYVKKGVAPPYFLVPSTRQILAGDGLEDGGALSGDVTLSLADLDPSPAGSYTRASITVDAKGRITAATSGSGADITDVLPGAGLTGGGSSGAVYLAIDYDTSHSFTGAVSVGSFTSYGAADFQDAVTVAGGISNGASPVLISLSTAATSTVGRVLTIYHLTSETATVGWGAAILFTGEDQSGTDEMGEVGFAWADKTTDAEYSQWYVAPRVAGAALSSTRTTNVMYLEPTQMRLVIKTTLGAANYGYPGFQATNDSNHSLVMSMLNGNHPSFYGLAGEQGVVYANNSQRLLLASDGATGTVAVGTNGSTWTTWSSAGAITHAGNLTLTGSGPTLGVTSTLASGAAVATMTNNAGQTANLFIVGASHGAGYLGQASTANHTYISTNAATGMTIGTSSNTAFAVSTNDIIKLTIAADGSATFGTAACGVTLSNGTVAYVGTASGNSATTFPAWVVSNDVGLGGAIQALGSNYSAVTPTLFGVTTNNMFKVTAISGSHMAIGTLGAQAVTVGTDSTGRTTWSSAGDVTTTLPSAKTFYVLRGTAVAGDGYAQPFEVLDNTASADIAAIIRQKHNTGSAGLALRNDDSPNSVFSLGKYGTAYPFTNAVTADATAAVTVAYAGLNLTFAANGDHLIAMSGTANKFGVVFGFSTGTRYTPFVIDGATRITSFYQKGVGTAQTIGVSISNTTAAALGAQQYSPLLVLEGQGWKTDATAASQSVRAGWQLVPVQGAAAPTANLTLYSSIDNAAFVSTGVMISLGGNLTVPNNVIAGNGGTPGAFGGDRIYVSADNTSFKIYNGGSATAGIELFGNTHATKANKIEITSPTVTFSGAITAEGDLNLGPSVRGIYRGNDNYTNSNSGSYTVYGGVDASTYIRLYGSASGNPNVIELTAPAGTTAQRTDAVTNAVSDVLKIAHYTTGTATTAFGVGLLFQLENGSGTPVDAGRMSVKWVDATGGSEDSRIAFGVCNGGSLSDAAYVTEWGRFLASGPVEMVGADTAQYGFVGDEYTGLFHGLSGGVYMLSSATTGFSAWDTGTSVYVEDATTNALLEVTAITYAVTSSGAGAAGLGVGVSRYMPSTTGSSKEAGIEGPVWAVATNGSETAKWQWFLRKAGALMSVPTLELHPSTGSTIAAEDGATNDVLAVASLARYSTSTVAAGFGAALHYQLENASGTLRSAGRSYALWTDPTNSTEESDFVIEAVTSGSLSEALRIASAYQLLMPSTTPLTNANYSFAGDGNTGIAYLGADQAALRAGGTDALTWGSTYAQAGGRLQYKQGANVSSANNLTLGGDGNVFIITGAVQINLINTTGWQNGSVIYLQFASTPTVKDNQTASGSNATIRLVGATDFTATADDLLVLVLISGTWWQVLTSVLP